MEWMPGDYEFVALRQGSVIQRQWHKNKLILIRALKFLRKDDIVLDAGCGPGNAVLEFASYVRKIEGWDFNKACINFLNLQIKRRKIKNASGYYKNLLKIDGREKKFSKIILTEVIEHFSEDDYIKMLKNLRSLLIDRGEIIITTPNDYSLWPLLEFLLNFIQTIPKLKDRHLARFTKGKLERIIRNSGFEIKRSGTINFISPFLIFSSGKFRDKIARQEALNNNLGALLYVVAKKR